MAELFTLENLFTLGVLSLLQAVLGFDNLLYISLESKRVTPELVLAVLVIVDLVQSRYQKKLLAMQAVETPA